MKRDHRDGVRAELSEYFAYEGLGVPAIDPQPRAGTTSLEPRAPSWGPGANPELMAAVYRRLQIVQQFTEIRVFAALRLRYGQGSAPRDQAEVAAEQAKAPHWARQIDYCEELYARVRDKVPTVTYRERVRRRLDAMWERAFG